MQGRNRDTEVENGYVDTGREAEGGTNWEMRILTLPAVKYTVRTGCIAQASQVALVVKNPPDNAEDLRCGGEDPLEKGTTTHSRILAWRIPWTEEPRAL